MSAATWCGLCGPHASCAGHVQSGVLVRRGALPRPPDRVQVVDELPARTRSQRAREITREAFAQARRAGQ